MKKMFSFLSAIAFAVSVTWADGTAFTSVLPSVATSADSVSVTATDSIPLLGTIMNMRIDYSVTNRLFELQHQHETLRSQLDEARKLIESKVEGASAPTMEQFYLRQDSICLDISSQIKDIELEIDRITKK